MALDKSVNIPVAGLPAARKSIQILSRGRVAALRMVSPGKPMGSITPGGLSETQARRSAEVNNH